ncbi:MAG: hypothetical protein QM811_08860 [Pirellulales bacterium]
MRLARFLPRRFSLRTLLALVTLFAVIFGWQLRRYQRFHDRVDAKATLESLGFRFYEQEQSLVPRLASESESRFDAWDRYWFGDEATKLYLEIIGEPPTNSPSSNGDVPNFHRLFRHFPELERVQILPTLSNTTTDDAALSAAIARLPELRRYSPRRVDDDWATALPPNAKLRELRFMLGSENALTSAGLQDLLRKAPDLSDLTIPHHILEQRHAEWINKNPAWSQEAETRRQNSFHIRDIQLVIQADFTQEAFDLDRLAARYAISTRITSWSCRPTPRKIRGSTLRCRRSRN